ncbi:UNVERIFIED_CONTAM: hypothetical protein FKN15_007437 [Acipenser sinensis]
MLYQTSLCFTMLPYALPDLSVLYRHTHTETRYGYAPLYLSNRYCRFSCKPCSKGACEQVCV